MTEMSSKIRIKIGPMELDYEGDPSFLDGGIEKLLVTMGELAGKIPSATAPIDNGTEVENTPDGISSTPPAASSGYTTSTLASHTNAKTATELALCAMAYLMKVKGQTSSNRLEILAEMKTATAFYNSNMAGNNSSNLESLAKSKKINEVATGKYALSSSELKRFEGVIAEID